MPEYCYCKTECVHDWLEYTIPDGYEPRVHDIPMSAKEAVSWARDWERRGYKPILIADGDGYRIYGNPPRY